VKEITNPHAFSRKRKRELFNSPRSIINTILTLRPPKPLDPPLVKTFRRLLFFLSVNSIYVEVYSASKSKFLPPAQISPKKIKKIAGYNAERFPGKKQKEQNEL